MSEVVKSRDVFVVGQFTSAGAKEGAEKGGFGAERFPQWLKPYCSTCGATKVAPF